MDTELNGVIREVVQSRGQSTEGQEPSRSQSRMEQDDVMRPQPSRESNPRDGLGLIRGSESAHGRRRPEGNDSEATGQGTARYGGNKHGGPDVRRERSPGNWGAEAMDIPILRRPAAAAGAENVTDERHENVPRQSVDAEAGTTTYTEFRQRVQAAPRGEGPSLGSRPVQSTEGQGPEITVQRYPARWRQQWPESDHGSGTEDDSNHQPEDGTKRYGNPIGRRLPGRLGRFSGDALQAGLAADNAAAWNPSGEDSFEMYGRGGRPSPIVAGPRASVPGTPAAGALHAPGRGGAAGAVTLLHVVVGVARHRHRLSHRLRPDER